MIQNFPDKDHLLFGQHFFKIWAPKVSALVRAIYMMLGGD